VIYLDWFDALKFHPELNRIMDKEAQGKTFLIKDFGNDENKVKVLWNASNPKDRYMRDANPRTTKYPIDRWFGLVTKEGDKDRLVAISGFAERDGKEGKQFAYLGGTKVSEDYKGGTIRINGSKAVKLVLGARTGAMTVDNPHNQIAGYSAEGWSKLGSKRNNIKVDTHDVIPDDVIRFFEETYGKRWTLMGPKINKSWMEELRLV
tara:strand:- start:678 stop:1295 length:618 start_codon:yes stop_codon:yes gene_type:complete